MNRYTLPRDFEDALLRRAEQCQDAGAVTEAAEYRRLARRMGNAQVERKTCRELER